MLADARCRALVQNQPSAEKEQANSHARDFTEADIADGQAGRFGWVEAPRLSAAARGAQLSTGATFTLEEWVPMTGVFISYRRDDRPGFAARLAEALEDEFGAEHVFRDVEDIRPGEDFVTVIETRLQAVDVVLAVIGPAWLSTERNGIRRLDEPGDFVRLEIASALKSGKPVWPVLVGGAEMPSQADLPEPIRALARRHAVVLTDPGWRDDVNRLIAALRPLLRPPRRTRTHLWGLAGVLIVALTALLWTISDGLPPARPATTAQPGDASTAEAVHAALSGHWHAHVRYDWGAEHPERFDLSVEGDEVHGTASYLRRPRIIEQGEVRDGTQLRFITRTDAIAGSETLTLTHSYRGKLREGALHFTLETTGSRSGSEPVEFIARRGDSEGQGAR